MERPKIPLDDDAREYDQCTGHPCSGHLVYHLVRFAIHENLNATWCNNRSARFFTDWYE